MKIPALALSFVIIFSTCAIAEHSVSVPIKRLINGRWVRGGTKEYNCKDEEIAHMPFGIVYAQINDKWMEIEEEVVSYQEKKWVIVCDEESGYEVFSVDDQLAVFQDNTLIEDDDHLLLKDKPGPLSVYPSHLRDALSKPIEMHDEYNDKKDTVVIALCALKGEYRSKKEQKLIAISTTSGEAYNVASLKNRKISEPSRFSGLSDLLFIELEDTQQVPDDVLDNLDAREVFELDILFTGEKKLVFAEVKTTTDPDLCYASINGKWVPYDNTTRQLLSQRLDTPKGSKHLIVGLLDDDLVTYSVGGTPCQKSNLLYDHPPKEIPESYEKKSGFWGVKNQSAIPVLSEDESGKLTRIGYEILPGVSSDKLRLGPKGRPYAQYENVWLPIKTNTDDYFLNTEGHQLQFDLNSVDRRSVAMVNEKLTLVKYEGDGAYSLYNGLDPEVMMHHDSILVPKKVQDSDYPEAAKKVLSKEYYYIPVANSDGTSSEVKAQVLEVGRDDRPAFLIYAFAEDGKVYHVARDREEDRTKPFRLSSDYEQFLSVSEMHKALSGDDPETSVRPYSDSTLRIASAPVIPGKVFQPVADSKVVAVSPKGGDVDLLASHKKEPTLQSVSSEEDNELSSEKSSLFKKLAGYGLSTAGVLSIVYSIRQAIAGLHAWEKQAQIDTLSLDEQFLWQQARRRALRKMLMSGAFGAAGLTVGMLLLRNKTAAAA